MLPNEQHSQPGGDSDCLAAAAEMLIDAEIQLQIARNKAGRCLTEAQAKGDYFMSQLEASGLDAFDHLVFTHNCQTWIIHVDLEDGSVRSVVPALEIE